MTLEYISQARQFLVNFDLYCTNLNIQYSLYDSLLINAVRQVPYDEWEDMRVVLNREQYRLFLLAWEKEKMAHCDLLVQPEGIPFEWGASAFVVPEGTTLTDLEYPKVPFLRIYVIDYFSGSWKKARRHYSWCNKVFKLYQKSVREKGIWRILSKWCPLLYPASLAKRLLAMMTEGKRENSDYAAIALKTIWYEYFKSAQKPACCLDEYIRIQFEGHSFLIMKDYKTYLNHPDEKSVIPISIPEYRSIVMDTMISFDKFCKQYHIQYSLAFGTLIGAIREKGFIPWDVDMDLMMTREDYDRLSKAYQENLPEDWVLWGDDLGSDQFQGECNRILPMKYLKSSQLHPAQYFLGSIYIDLYIADGIPESSKEAKRFFESINTRRKEYNLLRNKSIQNGSYAEKSEKINRLLTEITKDLRRYPLGETLSFTMACGDVFEKTLIKKKYFENFIEVEFEGNKLMAIADYDVFLRDFYGDYMVLPPRDERYRVYRHYIPEDVYV